MAENKDMTAWLKSKLNDISGIIHETADEAAEEGKNITRHNIETRGTTKSGKRGRVETGAMRDRVDGRVTGKTYDSATAEFGWLDGQNAYEWFQEFGFVHRGGTIVEGMYAITDASDEVRANVRDRLKDKLRGL